MIFVLRRMPARYSVHWLAISFVLFGIYLAALYVSLVLLDLASNTQNMLGYAILALLMTLAVVTGGFFGAKVYSLTALIFSGIAVVHLVGVAAVNPTSGWSDLISVIGFMFWGGMAIGGGIIAQLICSIRASKKQFAEIVVEETPTDETATDETPTDETLLESFAVERFEVDTEQDEAEDDRLMTMDDKKI